MQPRTSVTLVGVTAVLLEAGAATAQVAGGTLDRVAAFLLCAAMATAVMTLALRRLLRPLPGGGADGHDGPSGPGQPPSPPWWPRFERDLRAYERSLERRPTAPL